MIHTLLILLAAQDVAPLKLKRHAFPDLHMGNVVAYTALLPEGWTSKGHVEWSAPPVAYPQANFELSSPEGGRVKYVPMLTFTYTESKVAQMPPQGQRPPDNLGEWVVRAVGQNRQRPVSNVKLIAERRDIQAEEAAARLAQQAGLANNKIRKQSHVITFEFDEAGVRYREDMSVQYIRYAPIDNVNIRSEMWSLYTSLIILGPAGKFDAMKPQLHAAAATVRPDPLWWVRQQEVIGELQRTQQAANWKAILERGAQISKASDAQMAAFKKQMAASDEAQKTRLDTIRERQDYKDTNGDAVNLPIHYKHVYSDGDGNYTLTNKPLNGEGWTEITPAK